MQRWARSRSDIRALVLIGSRVRSSTDVVWNSDQHSDWDFHLIASNVPMFADGAWTESLVDFKVIAHVSRQSRIGGVPKINVVFYGAEADIVIISARKLAIFAVAVQCKLHLAMPFVRRGLRDLAVVIRPGWKFLKGSSFWERFYEKSVSDSTDPRLSDRDICVLANGFFCDFVGISRKIDRGEFIAAQRLIHRDLAETNFRLLHELRLRRNVQSFPEARRIERLLDRAQLVNVMVDCRPDSSDLTKCIYALADGCRFLTNELVGSRWCWPLTNFNGRVDFPRR